MVASKTVLSSLLLILVLISAGCAKNTEQVKAHYYPKCHEPLAYLHERTAGTGKAVAGSIVQGGVISGIAAAIAGAITGHLRPIGVLAGVGAGAAVGGIVGGASQHANLEKADNQHLAKYMEEIDGDISDMDIVTAAATVSKQCYSRAFTKLTQEMREGTIDNQTATARFEEIAAGTREADKLLKLNPDLNQMEREFNAVRSR